MSSFNRSRILVLAILVAVTFTGRAFAEGESVVAPAKRQEILDRAKSILATPAQPTAIKDPFHSEAYADSLAGAVRTPEGQVPAGDNTTTRTTPTGPRNARDLLQTIAASLKPSGFFVLGGEPTLVFGQKRVKAGGFLTITFEGNEYTLEIASIERPNFTLRLNREEFTRPIK
jgi:hypothetical protein